MRQDTLMMVTNFHILSEMSMFYVQTVFYPFYSHYYTPIELSSLSYDFHVEGFIIIILKLQLGNWRIFLLYKDPTIATGAQELVASWFIKDGQPPTSSPALLMTNWEFLSLMSQLGSSKQRS